MDIFDIRRANLKQLLERMWDPHPHLRKKDLALELDMSPSYLSQLIGGKRMGDDVARKIEALKELPHGWMDQEHDWLPRREMTVSPRARTSQYLRIDPETIAAAIKLVRLTFQNLDVEFDHEKDGTPIAFAYDYLRQNAEREVTPENLVDFSKRLAERLKEKHDNQSGTGDAGGSGRGDSGEGEGRKAG